jgi:hypothetical protein
MPEIKICSRRVQGVREDVVMCGARLVWQVVFIFYTFGQTFFILQHFVKPEVL